MAWTTMNVKGPMARTVADTALLLSAIAGPSSFRFIGRAEAFGLSSVPAPATAGSPRRC
ncbi:hypothetical protein [Actinoallomurus vinaceus]|uniref:hypothetical protein n=1 Tax=Actinoallomurus vinaceus TaxID=1080074 RepID=UPI0031EB482A